MKKETYICNGKYFASFTEVEQYAASINCRVSNTETLKKGIYLISLQSV